MTIAIKISNEDSREKAIVRVDTMNSRAKSVLPIVTNERELNGGESIIEYVHSGQSIVVRAKSVLPIVTNERELKGGESIIEYVHSGQSIVVEEVENG